MDMRIKDREPNSIEFVRVLRLERRLFINCIAYNQFVTGANPVQCRFSKLSAIPCSPGNWSLIASLLVIAKTGKKTKMLSSALVILTFSVINDCYSLALNQKSQLTGCTVRYCNNHP